jgi:hypothetical protein
MCNSNRSARLCGHSSFAFWGRAETEFSKTAAPDRFSPALILRHIFRLPSCVSLAALCLVLAGLQAGCSLSASLSVTVPDAAPNISYTGSPFVFTVNQAISTLTPSNSGGAVISWSVNPVLPTGLNFSITSGMITGTPTSVTAAANYTVTATNIGGTSTAVLNITVNPEAPQFPATGLLVTARTQHTATLLNNGMVLIAGGQNSSNTATATAEQYNPASQTFTSEGPLGTARYFHTATLLTSAPNNGKVLIVGGQNSGGVLSSAELYDPNAGTFSATGSLITARAIHTATLLPSGKVLIVGGQNSGGVLSSAELYDPNAGTFSTTGSMANARMWHTATLLLSGKVLIAGGNSGGNLPTTSELFDPAFATFSGTGSMVNARMWHTATLLPSGKVLIAGGNNGGNLPTTSELFDPAFATFSPAASLITGRFLHTATLLNSGAVLIAAGQNSTGQLSSAELYR